MVAGAGRYKLINHYGLEWGGQPEWELIDLEADPGERTNVYGDAQYADFDGNGIVNTNDWFLFGKAYGQVCPP